MLVEHGKNGTYTKHGCRCPECTAAHAEHQRQYMAGEARRKRHREATRRWRAKKSQPSAEA